MATYPIQFAQVFKQGDAQSPVCAINNTPIPTQVNVLSRWSDNSVRHAIFTVILTGNVNDLVTLQFVEGTPLGTTAGTLISFTAGIKVFNQPEKLLSSISGTPWITGPLCSVYIHADHSGGNDISGRMRPIFHVAHWHTIGNARVRFIGEVSKINSIGEYLLGDPTQPLILTINGATVYSLSGRQWFDQMMSYASRWTRVFWVNGTPSEPQVLKNDMVQMRDSGASHYFDTSITVSESAIASMYQQWVNKVQVGEDGLLKAGLWNKAMGNAGGSDYIGPWTTWAMLLLYSGDKRMREVCEGQANLGCQWPMHYRELSGAYYSVENHTSCQLLNLTQNLARSGITLAADLDSWGWNPDTSHQPDHYFPLFLLTGDFFHYEQAAFWASWSCAFYNHQATGNTNGCGPTGAEGGIPGMNSVTIRGQAWVFRSRCEVASFAPDTMLEKPYFIRMVEDCIQIWEGERNITTTPNNATANWNWGRAINPQAHPLRFWEHGNSAFILNQNGTPNGDVDPSKASTGLSTWEQNFLVLALARGLELGFATDALMNWILPCIQGQQENLDWKIASNRSPTRNPGGAFFTNWTDLEVCYDDAWALGEGYTYQGRFQEKIPDLNHGYTNIALASARALNVVSPFMTTNAVGQVWSSNPKWAILTRPSQPPPPPPPPPPSGGNVLGHRVTSGTKIGGGMKIGGT